MDNGSPVSEAYEPPFAYTGTINAIKIKIGPSTLNASEQQTVRDMRGAAAMTIE
jgi:hypothetical protein